MTFFLPVPELNSTPVLITSLLNGTAYGVSPDWNLSVVRQNGTPMLAIRADRMVPEYHGYPIAIEPGTTVLPTTLVPGHEYSGDTPVLMPVTIAVMEATASEIDTRDPVGHEPLFFPGGTLPRDHVTCTGMRWVCIRPPGPGIRELYLGTPGRDIAPGFCIGVQFDLERWLAE